MESIIKAVVVYVGLLVLFRLSGKRTLAEVSPFDLVLLLIISEAVQQALIDSDNSMTNGFLLVTTLVALNVVMSEVKLRWKRAERVLDYLHKVWRRPIRLETIDSAGQPRTLSRAA